MAANLSFLKSIPSVLGKVGIGLGIILAIIGIAAGGYFFFKWAEHKSDQQLAAAVAAAHAQGVAEAQRDTTQAVNAQLQQNIAAIQQLEADTNKKMAHIRVVAAAEKRSIDNYDAGKIAVDHPDQVEKWANDTTSGIFKQIEEASQ